MIKEYKLEELTVGQKYEFDLEITEEKIHSFSIMFNDHHPLHSDRNYAVNNGFDGVIAQGYFLISHLSAVVGMRLPGKNALIISQESRFLRPVYLQEIVHYSCEISKIESRFKIIDISFEITNRNLETCVSGTVKVKVRQ